MKNSTLFFRIIIPMIFLALAISGKAQLAGWKYRDPIKILENSNKAKVNYQVLLNINTQVLITAGKMKATGSDIRFSKDCNGAVLYPYWIESGINTANTQIWVLVDSLAANGSRIINMWYGNSAATATASFDSTFTPASRLIVNAGTTVAQTGVNNYSWFEVQSTASVTVSPNSVLKINARRIIVAGTISGDGAGFLGGVSASNGQGPGGGKASIGNNGTWGGGGAGYGADGGKGGGNATANYNDTGKPGLAYGTANTDSIDMGSGGSGGQGVGGNGGGAVVLSAAVLDLKASSAINMRGDMGGQAVLNGGGGGGAGGGILIKGDIVNIAGTLRVTGGKGGDGAYGGGGGAGGRIKILYDKSVAGTATTSLLGGAGNFGNGGTFLPGTMGDTGTFYQGTFLAKEPTITLLGTPSAGPDVMICQGYSTQLAATGGTAYSWSPAAGLSCTTCANPVATPTVTTDYIVVITANACTTNDTVKVTVDPCTGIISHDDASLISVMPNPSNGVMMLNMEGVNGKVVFAELYNVQGKLAGYQRMEVHNGILNEQLDFYGLARGVYNLKLSSEGIIIGNNKIIIQ